MLAAAARALGLAGANPDVDPPPGTFQSIPGYTDCTFVPVIQSPPPSLLTPGQPTEDATGSPPRATTTVLPSSVVITEEEIRVALNRFVDGDCCFQSADKDNFLQFPQYTLQSFTEQRRTAWKCEPAASGVQMQIYPPGDTVPVLGPWEINLYPEGGFKKQEKRVRVPNTSTVRVCHICCRNGRVRCDSCSGHGGSFCGVCNGTGRTSSGHHGHHHHHHHRHHHHACNLCHGSGRKRCSSCSGHGQRQCHQCKGNGQLHFYLQLVVSWAPFQDQFLSSGGAALPRALLLKTAGFRVLSEEQHLIQPFTHTQYPDQTLISASRELVDKHRRLYTRECRIIKQKHVVDVVRIAEVTYTWKSETEAHVYGEQSKLHFPDYPGSWCCAIL